MTKTANSEYLTQLWNPKFRGPNTSGWQDRHRAARLAPSGSERPIMHMLQAWAEYADEVKARYGSGIGEDQVLGPAWAAIGASVRTLLNGDCGRLDCGTLDAFIHNTLTSERFDPDRL